MQMKSAKRDTYTGSKICGISAHRDITVTGDSGQLVCYGERGEEDFYELEQLVRAVPILSKFYFFSLLSK